MKNGTINGVQKMIIFIGVNNGLKNLFGIDTISGLPIWRVVFSEDQFEKRLGTYDDFSKAGLYLRTVTEVREVPKYRQWIKEKYVLEQLVVIPEASSGELPAAKISYEPLWVFQDGNGNYLPPRSDACKLIVDTVYAATGKSSLAKYKDPEGTAEEALELKKIQIDKIEEELFGEESSLNGAIVHGWGVGYTGPSKVN